MPKQKKDYIIFRLTEENTGGSMPDIPFPPSKTIPAIQEVFDPESNRMRLMRYVPYEKSIWVDEQNADFSWEDFRIGKGIRLQKPEFKDGYLVVNHRQDRLIEYLRKAKNNVENAEINGTNGWTFFEMNLEKESEDHLEWIKQETERNHKIFTMKEDDVKGIAVLMGLSYKDVFDRTKEEVQLAVMDKASQDPDKFEAVLANDLNHYKLEVVDALKVGILKKEGDLVIKWEDGTRAATAPEGTDPIQILAEKMINDTALTSALRNRIRIKKGGYENFKSQEEIIESSVDVLEGLEKTEVIEKLIQENKAKAGILDRSGALFYLGDEKLLMEESTLRGYEAVSEYLLQNEEAYNRAKAKLVIYLTK